VKTSLNWPPNSRLPVSQSPRLQYASINSLIASAERQTLVAAALNWFSEFDITTYIPWMSSKINASQWSGTKPSTIPLMARHSKMPKCSRMLVSLTTFGATTTGLDDTDTVAWIKKMLPSQFLLGWPTDQGWNCRNAPSKPSRGHQVPNRPVMQAVTGKVHAACWEVT
jgi:hypothetical protein